MGISKVLAAAALGAVVLGATACSGIVVRWKPTIDCYKEPHMCQTTHEMQKSDASPLSAIEVEVFDPSMSAMDFADSNVEFVSDQVPYVVSVTRNGIVTATAGFTAVRSGMRYVPADPAAIKAWLRQHAVGATSIAIDVRGMRFVDAPGTNVVSVRSLYGNTEFSGATTAWYVGPNDQREIQ